ncbi:MULTISPECIES: 5,6-dimethylbenzimidazole synthase [unclassified Ruegeria]|uniref:5,6-dimethylbenzimidazole synthase n=1 Tax=unclassified Ruegeria TaxID=2625375 RepID=UPI001489F4EE|nr:5,6-dimethylbenzimidazole synthase [Ruegeria sp. HKCCD4332]NOD90690.1 5,6-dimethylbenzimidazole synthase [Ruegeria sp. HKCCD4318]NOE15807.1 5,6-dimethylbenzimidazole synthase [Ruegeria sp. HKCCD4318-2]NOG07920.1 5,6-dimethylbenzimidazole synthase [Ruegeria sp. HKCCD4315]
MRDQTFTDDFRTQFDLLLRLRRDVRRFRTDTVDEAVLLRCLDAFQLAPSVGLSEPWRVIRVESEAARAAALKNFQTANDDALAGYSGDKAQLYSRLKLSGMQEAPVQLAVFCDDSTDKGMGLGAGTMPEMRRYSVVSAITLFWLALRAEGLGLGWVSILDPEQMIRDLSVPEDWRLIGYFCVGWPEQVSDTPELEQVGWENRAQSLAVETR